MELREDKSLPKKPVCEWWPPGFEPKILQTWATSHAGAVNLKLFLNMLTGMKAVLSGLTLVSGSGAAVLRHKECLFPGWPSGGTGGGATGGGPCELSQQRNRGTWF